MTTNRPLRVFLCHSSADKPAVRELYQKLRNETWLEPWLDEEELYPGQDWEIEIEKAVESSDVVLVCLSNGSINKRGFVQKELRFALDVALEMPEETIFIVPLRLEECTPPRSLRDWQYADYFEDHRDRALERLLVSLKRRAESLGYDTKTNRTKQETLINIEKDDDAILLKKAILIIQGEKFASVSRLQRLLHVGYTRVTHLLDKLEKLGIVGPPQGSLEEREVFVGEKYLEGKKDEIDWEKIVRDSQPANVKTAIDPFEKETLLGKNQQKALIKHANPDWGSESKISLSNGMEFMRVPAGKFLMGSENDNKLASSDEKPQHTVDIPFDYWMARYPVTNGLYNAYVKSKRIIHPVDDLRNKKDHPVVSVSWNDAMAFCQWLNSRLKAELPSGLGVRLPTEAEWEKAARGTNRLEYPWGSIFDKNKCNTREGGKGWTTSVGLYSPQGDSPFGCADMSGNVWEWTHSIKKAYPYKVNDGREDEKASKTRVLRGGSFDYDERIARCAYRVNGNVVEFILSIGFRVVVSQPIQFLQIDLAEAVRKRLPTGG